MHEIRIRPRARQDLKEIWRFTADKWGEAQADLYLGQIDTAIRSLRDYPEIGEPAEHVRPAYRKLQVNRHLIFYRTGDKTIDIVRVLHQSMDIARRL